MDYIKIAKNTILGEAKALEMLASCIDDTFTEIVELFMNCSGNIIFSGVGKSGNVAEKISSSFSSIGVPAFYISPLDLYHGGLGIFQDRDIFVAISKSGNTQELNQCVSFVKSRNIRIVSLTSNIDSELSNLSDYTLLTHAIDEACPLNIVPTTSIITALALGDAIVCALIKAKDITKQKFINTHPGGTLGK